MNVHENDVSKSNASICKYIMYTYKGDADGKRAEYNKKLLPENLIFAHIILNSKWDSVPRDEDDNSQDEARTKLHNDDHDNDR